MTDSIAISHVSSAMAHLVADRGWSLLHSTRSGIATSAVIEKDGVIFGYALSGGDTHYSVTLRSRVHPVIDLQLSPPSDLNTTLEGIGIDYAERKEMFLTADRHLPAIKRYLYERAVWERHVEGAAKAMADRYREWIDGPEITREVAQSMARRHPWLKTGIIPSPANLAMASSTLRSELSRFRSAIVLGVIGIGVLAAHYLT